MASSRQFAPQAPAGPHDFGYAPEATEPFDAFRPNGLYDQRRYPAEPGPAPQRAAMPRPYAPGVQGDPEGPGGGTEWNPSEETVRPVRGRHRVAKQRRAMSRSTAVLGVGMIAAVGAGGVATANGKSTSGIHMPDMATAGHAVSALPDKVKEARNLPGVRDLVGTEDAHTMGDARPLTDVAEPDAQHGRTADAGEALRSRILAQAQAQQSKADAAAQAAAAHAAQVKAQAEAEAEHRAEQAEKARKIAEQKRKEEAARLAKLARSFKLPVGSYTLTAGFGQAGSIWQADHTGQDFAAPTGTPIKAVHGGTVVSAGWAGSYGYRTVIKMDNGTELWFCHQSSMLVKAGDRVTTGQVIGRVGATGNTTGPHLHLEVRPGGGSPIDPMPWLREHGLQP